MRPKRLSSEQENPGIDVMIDCQDGVNPDAAEPLPEGLAATLRAAALAALPEKIRGDAQLCVTLSDDATLAALNERWRHKQGPTNVLAFPLLSLTPEALPPPGAGAS